MNASSLKISGLTVSSFSAAGKAMASIQAAINSVSTQRSKLGALQNRLDNATTCKFLPVNEPSSKFIELNCVVERILSISDVS